MPVCILGVIFIPTSFAGYTSSPRQTGVEVLEELLMGPAGFIIRVASNGCTDKRSFRIDVEEGPGSSTGAAHYTLTIIRIKPDECKAIVEGGVLILFDLEKDLGLTGEFTYAITNPVLSSLRIQPSDDSLFSIIEKYFTIDLSEIRVNPEPCE